MKVKLIDSIRSGCIVYGPYKRKDDDRAHVILYWPPPINKRQTISYPKWIMEQHLGRILSDVETVDHINRDCTDHQIENLQILIREEHTRLDSIRAKLVEIICVYCEKSAFKRGNDIRHNSKLGRAGPFCSRKCAGLYSKDVKAGKKPLPAQLTASTEYYRLSKYK